MAQWWRICSKEEMWLNFWLRDAHGLSSQVFTLTVEKQQKPSNDQRMPFRPGQSGNPGGRKPGALGKKTLAAQQAIDVVTTEDANGRKVVDALELLSAIVSAPETNVALRISAASALAPYQHSRKASRYIEHTIDLPAPTTVEQATENIAKLASLAAAKTIALDEMNDLIGAQKAFIDARSDTETELRLANIERLLREHPHLSAIDMQVIGGLPGLPGTSILMPPPAMRIKPGNGEPGS